jgi:N-dimethylarginine dimethylaminohydrolase
VFEGADALWLDEETVLLGRGLRTNNEGVVQIACTLAEQRVATIVVDLDSRAMHLMGVIRIVDRDLAYVHASLTPVRAVQALRERGYEVRPFPDEKEADERDATNFVTLGPRRIVLPAGNVVTEAAFRSAGIECIATGIRELSKAAGAIGCLTGVLQREHARGCGDELP